METAVITLIGQFYTTVSLQQKKKKKKEIIVDHEPFYDLAANAPQFFPDKSHEKKILLCKNES